MAGKSSRNGNWAPNSPATRYKASGKNREFYTFENAPGLGNYATGGTIIDGGDGYIYHIFTGDGTFTVNRPPAAIDSVDYLIVAGGGASGSGSLNNWSGGAGGAGGMLFGNTGVSIGSYPITIGAGGASNGPGNTSASRHGFDSSAFGLTTEGGGGGGCPGPLTTHTNGDPGGSGGGASSVPPTSGRPGGTGNTPATIPRQGYPASTSIPSALDTYGAGGGGAGGGGGYIANEYPVGPPYQFWGYGGPGRVVPEFPIDIIGRAIPSTNYPQWYDEVSPSGLAAGGRSYYRSLENPVPIGPDINSAANSGNGGNGNGSNPGKNGGSGIVCIRYKKTAAYSRATGGTIEPNTHPEHPGVWRHIFTEPGTFEVTDPTLQWIDYLAVGGGGGGGGSPTSHGGGGGGGGFVSSIHTSASTPLIIPQAYPWSPGSSVEVGKQYPVGVGTYPISIGTGGNAGTVGNNTTIGSGPTQIIAAGGGRGATSPGAGGAGGSGGGGAKPTPSTTPLPGGTATPTPLIQGNPGGSTPTTTTTAFASGGGGGGAAGGATGVGGAGWYSVLSPSAYGTPGPLSGRRYFAGGGGGRSSIPGGGGEGGGGDGSTTTSGTPGTTNTGGGGGGGTSAPGGTGGPGIVIIQYPE